jgi:uncharacterized membrane protein YkvA (DUF1232 family)
VPSLRQRAELVTRKCVVLAAALRHARTPWYAKVTGTLTLLYALSPIDLIPDFIPVLGALDDIVIVPLGIWLTTKWIPAHVWQECEARVAQEKSTLKRDWRGALLVVAVWLALLALGILVVRAIV